MCNRKHVYKVGDKGKLVNGNDYEVIAVVPHLPRPIIISVSVNGNHSTIAERDLDGRFDEYDKSPMLPPKRVVYVNICQNGGDAFPKTHLYEDEDKARFAANCYQGNNYLKIAHPIELD